MLVRLASVNIAADKCEQVRGHFSSMLGFSMEIKHLLHRNEEGIQINVENTASHETVYKLAHRADKANFSSECLVM
jgi:hypothetical protein